MSIKNFSTAIFLVNKDVIALTGHYEQDPVNGPKAPREIFKTFDKTLKKGDIIVVPSTTRHHVTTCMVDEVGVQIDLNSSATVRWVIGPVDMAGFEKTKASEDAMIHSIKQAEALHEQEELRSKLLKSMPPGALDNVSLVNVALPKPDPKPTTE